MTVLVSVTTSCSPMPLDVQDFYQILPRVLANAKRLYGSFTFRPRCSIKRLPNELLSTIFTEATIGHNDYSAESMIFPITISHVCSRWRQVSLSTASLWTKIIVTFPTSAMQLSRTLTWLTRSRASCIDILLDFRDPSWDWEEDSHTFRWKDMEVVTRLLLTHVERWRRIDLLTDTWEPIFTFLWYSRRVQSAPMLEAVTLSRCNAYFVSKGETFQPVSLKQPIALFGGHQLEKLRDVSLVGVHVDWVASRLSDLVTLELKYHAHDVMPSVEEFADILAACPGLQHLAIVGWGPRFEDPLALPPNGMIGRNFDHSTQGLRSIKMAHLTRFVFGFVDVEYAVELLSLFSFPSLKELSLEDVMKTINPSEVQDATALLEWLVYTHSSKCLLPSHTSSCCGMTSLPLENLVELEIEGLQSSETSFGRLFHQTTKLRHLRLHDVPVNALYALAPTRSVSSSIQPTIPCTKLCDLNCRNLPIDILAEVIAARIDAISTEASPENLLVHINHDSMLRSKTSDVQRLTNVGVRLAVSDADDNILYLP